MDEHLDFEEGQAFDQNETSYCIHAGTVPQASKLFEKARQNLFQVNRWHQLAGSVGTQFQLTDKEGIVVNRTPISGDYICMEQVDEEDIKTYKWVQVEEIEERAMHAYHISAAIKVRPATMPNLPYTPSLDPEKSPTISAFSVERIGSMVYASIYVFPKNEVQESAGWLTRLRGSLVELGKSLGLVKSQFKNLAKGMLSL